MKNTSFIFIILAIVLMGGVVAFATKVGNASRAVNRGTYCSPDGTLSSDRSIQSHRSYCIKPDTSGKAYPVNSPSEYSFSIIDDEGSTVKEFTITHTKQMHVIVARKDLAYFQHVHPEFSPATGTFTLNGLTFPADGEYRIFADFAVSNGQKDSMGMPLAITASEDVLAGSRASYTPVALGSEERTKSFDGYQVALSTKKPLVSGTESTLTFTLNENGKSVTDLQEYLGALGHSVILREGNLDFIHAHPIEDVSVKQNGKVNFMVDFPEAGKYKVFTQFQRNGKVFTTDFVVTVAQGANSSAPMNGTDMNASMDHSMHMMQ